MNSARLVRVNWRKFYRIVGSNYPPINLFEGIANPADWELIAAAKAETDPAFRSAAGNLSNVPLGRRVVGPGASWVMTPFVHCSRKSPNRFSDGSYGIFYAGNSEQVALAETIHHHAAFMSNASATPGWTSGFRVLVGSIDRELHDVDAVFGARDPDDYRLSQLAGKALRDAGSDGLTWTSTRRPEGRCIGVFWPDVVTIPILSASYSYHWDGARIDLIEKHDTGEIIQWS